MKNVNSPYWYAAYTRSRAEKAVARELELQHVDYYLPLYKTIRQWSDRKKKVEVPLIRSYIFVYITAKEYRKVIETQGVVNIIHFSGKPVPIPAWQIENLKIVLGAGVPITHEIKEFTGGELVCINQGALAGLRGTVIHVKGKRKLVISINALNYNLTIDINRGFVECV